MVIKKLYALVLKCIRMYFGGAWAKKFDTRLRFGRRLNLREPKTLSDKVSWLSLYENDKNQMICSCTDKFAVREYIAKKGLEHTLIPLVGGPWDCAEDICFEELPNAFILKATHGCKMNYPVPNKQELDLNGCKTQMQKWLNTTYGTYSMELHYEKIPHRLFAEQLLDNADSLIDYKFHCLNGEPRFVLVCSERLVADNRPMAVTLDLFNMNWIPIRGLRSCGSECPGTGNIPQPECFEEMIQIARELAADFRFVRVDLYEVNGMVFFGELTFTPGCGVFPYFTDDFDAAMGNELTLF